MADMRTAYASRCAYSAMPLLGDASIDHFAPKAIYPRQAYEWGNYRLCMNILNGNKAADLTILDPFTIPSNWFHLDLANLYVIGNPDAPGVVKPRIDRTIKKLGLNDGRLVSRRFDIVAGYLNATLGIDFIREFYPFIAVELTRQNA